MHSHNAHSQRSPRGFSNNTLSSTDTPQSRPWIGTLPGSFNFTPRLLTLARSNPDKGGSSSSRVGQRRELTITSFDFSSYHITCGWSWRGDAMFGVPMPDPVFDLLQSFLNGIYNARFRTITTHPTSAVMAQR